MRPDEKLYEEVLSTAENTITTSHELIKAACVRQYDYNDVNTVFEQIKSLANDVNIPELVKLMKRTIPEFKSNNSGFEIYD